MGTGINIHQFIKNEYEKKRKRAQDKLDERKSELYYLIPRLEEIEGEIHAAGLRYNKAILMGTVSSDSAAARLSSTIEQLRSERADLLKANGYDENYLNPVYECQKCSDTGLVSSPDGNGDTLCICYRQLLLTYLYDQSNICLAGNGGLECFNTEFYPDIVDEEKYGIKKSPRRQIKGILEHCRSFINNFGSPDVKNLLFCGPTGVGKTFMAVSLAMDLMRSGHTVLYQTAPAL
jgi:DNA replication protein DnaC